MFELKPGVSVKGIQPEMCIASQVVESVYRHFGENTIITSACGGGDGPTYRHPKGTALDFRTTHVLESRILDYIFGAIKSALGEEFDVLLEARGEENEHIHVEFDPE